MSTPAAQSDGLVVITEVSPNENEGAPSKTRPTTDPLQTFSKGEPLALGVTQILCGIFQIFLGIVYDVHGSHPARFTVFLYFTGAPFWSGILYIICGSLSVAASKNPGIGLVRGSLAMNIIAAVASGVAIIAYSVYVTEFEPRQQFVHHYRFCVNSEEPERCWPEYQAARVANAILYMLLVLTILGFCSSISISAFGCKTLCRTAYSEASVVIYQTTPTQPAQPDVSAVPPLYPDAHAILPSFKDFGNP